MLKTALASTAFLLVLCSAHGGDAHFRYFRYEGQSQEKVRPGSGEYINPIISGYSPDPSITRVGKDYYLVNSSFTNFPGLPIRHSRDLITWRQIGNAIDRSDQFDFTGMEVSGGIMAPDISYHGGIFYIVSTSGRNFVITAKNPEGPWSAPKWLDFEGIDPSLFWEDDGTAYIVNNGPPEGEAKFDGHRVLWLQQFDPISATMTGPRTALVGGGENPPHLFWPEGPHIFKKSGWYYLIAAEGGTGPDEHHAQIVFRSRALKGPYQAFAGNPILTQADLPPGRSHPVEAAGHADFVTTPSGEWWSVFLAARSYAPTFYNIGRETYLLPVTWTADNWPVVLRKGAVVPFVVRRPAIAEARAKGQPENGNFGYFDSFSGTRLSFGWIGIRIPKQPLYRLRNGDLAMPAGNALGDTASTPACIGRKQAHAVAEVTTALTYNPEREGDRAGLAAVQSDNAYLFFGLTIRDGQRVVALMRRETMADPRQGVILSRVPIPPAVRSLRLKLKIDGGSLSASYAIGAQRWKTLRSGVDATFLSTKKARGFVGTVIGLTNERAGSSFSAR